MEVIPSHVEENNVTVKIPEHLTAEVAKSTMWKEYDRDSCFCSYYNRAKNVFAAFKAYKFTQF